MERKNDALRWGCGLPARDKQVYNMCFDVCIVCMYACTCVCISVCVYVSMCVCMHAFMYVSLFVCVCAYVCMYQ